MPEAVLAGDDGIVCMFFHSFHFTFPSLPFPGFALVLDLATALILACAALVSAEDDMIMGYLSLLKGAKRFESTVQWRRRLQLRRRSCDGDMAIQEADMGPYVDPHTGLHSDAEKGLTTPAYRCAEGHRWCQHLRN